MEIHSTTLAISAPNSAIGGKEEVGLIVILYGSENGLDSENSQVINQSTRDTRRR